MDKIQLEVNKEYDVTVTKILAKGCIVAINGTDATEFIHISKIAKGYVNNVNDYISVGESLKARAIISKDKPELSLQHLMLRSKTMIQTDSVSRKKPTTEQSKSLDAMIASADAALKDKLRHVPTATNSHQRKRRKTHRSENYD